MKKQTKIIIAVGIFCVLVVAGIFISKRNKVPPPEPAVVKIGDLFESTYAVGTVKADKIYNLKTGVNTKMLERFVHIGQKVKKGQPLVKLDTFPTYTAPFDGVVTVINYEMGELVFANSIVLTLVNEDELYIELSLDERSINKVRVGQEARISFENQKKKTRGKVRSVFSNADQFYVHLDFDPKDIVLLPGMTSDVSVITRKFSNATLIPIESLGEDDSVRKASDKNTPIKLSVDYRNDNYAVVTNSELKEGDVLFVPEEKAAKKKFESKSGGSGRRR